MKIAIIGSGFVGLATGWHLLNTLKASLTFFDPSDIGEGGASGIAAGLLHTYAGLHSKLNWKGNEGYESAYKLLEASTLAQGHSVFFKSGLLRIALTETNLKDYTLCAKSSTDVKMLTAEEISELAPGVVHRPGIFIESALTVYTTAYLKGLWQLCLAKGSLLEPIMISSLEELKDFDLIIVSTGAAAIQIKELSHLPINLIKGQLLELEWPSYLPIPQAPLNSQAYLVMNIDKRSCILGATYERNFLNSNPDKQMAIHDIMPKALAMMPALKNAKIVDCRSAIRASTLDHKPYLKKITPKCWVLAGMGSKGLLYHSYYAQKLVKEIISSL